MPVGVVVGGDWFIDLFDSEAEKLLEELGEESPRNEQPVVDRSWWVSGLPLPAPKERVVAAVDGGGGVEGVAGGGAIYVARAYGYVSDGSEPERVLELRLYPARDTEILDSMRTWVELRAAQGLVSRLGPGSVLLMDGSLYAIVSKAYASLLRAYRGAFSSPGSAYSLLFYMYVLSSISELVELSSKRGVLVFFVSKDHGYRFLKEKVLLEQLAKTNRSLRGLVEELLDWYPSFSARRKALRLRRSLGREERMLLDAALDPSYRDPWFIDENVEGVPGYTRPLRVPCSERVGRVVTYTGAGKVLEDVVENSGSIVSGRDYEELAAAARRLRRRIERLPGIAAFYTRLGREDSLLLVEYPLTSSPCHAAGRQFLGEKEALEALSVLVRDYGGPYYYNTPLIMAHISATLRGDQLESYTRLLEALASSRGYRLEFSRRTSLRRWLPGPRRRKKW